MNNILEGIGLLAIFLVIVYGYKKVLECHDLKRLDPDKEKEKAHQAKTGDF